MLGSKGARLGKGALYGAVESTAAWTWACVLCWTPWDGLRYPQVWLHTPTTINIGFWDPWDIFGKLLLAPGWGDMWVVHLYELSSHPIRWWLLRLWLALDLRGSGKNEGSVVQNLSTPPWSIRLIRIYTKFIIRNRPLTSLDRRGREAPPPMEALLRKSSWGEDPGEALLS
jgi:hypothetical protein